MDLHLTSFDWTRVEGHPVCVMKCGDWDAACEEKILFLVIPGNPGSLRFYQAFAETLFSESGIPVWGIAHTGHMSTPKKLPSMGDPYPTEHPKPEECGLSHQICHKIAFLEEEVLPEVDKVYLIGHSIGCYMILHILDRVKNIKLCRGIMLFPTIERMALSPRGQRLTPVLIYCRSAISALAWALNWLPSPLKKALVDCLFKAINQPSRLALLDDVIYPKAANCCSYMGMQEMLLVDKRDDHILKAHADKLHFYYGTIDHWCPVEYYEDMKKDYPNIDIRLCQNRFKHAFVLKESEEVATIVAEWVKNF